MSRICHEHCPSGKSAGGGVLLAVVVLVLAVEVVRHAAAVESFLLTLVLAVAAAAVAAVVVLVLVLGRGRLRHLPAAVRARARWRSHCRNLGLSRADAHARDHGRVKVRHLRAKIRPTVHGVEARLRTRPGTGRAEVEEAAEHFRNVWRCARVQVVQERPGRLRVIGLRADPLTQPYAATAAPRGVFDGTAVDRLYLGKDQAGEHRWLRLGRNVTGIVVAGQPGTGKTSLINSWLCQTSATPAVQFALCDGKGGADFEPWRSRAFLYSGDQLADAVAFFEDLHAEMRRRLTSWPSELGARNAWQHGPSEDYPLILWAVDETATFFDLTLYKGDRDREAMARRAGGLAAEVIRKSGSVMMTGVAAVQKPTSDSLPSQVTANCSLSVAFALRTVEGATAALGPDIKEYPSYSPLLLRDQVGVCSSTLNTGADPFALLRTPEVSEAMAEERAALSAPMRRDPAARAAAPVSS